MILVIENLETLLVPTKGEQKSIVEDLREQLDNKFILDSIFIYLIFYFIVNVLCTKQLRTIHFISSLLCQFCIQISCICVLLLIFGDINYILYLLL